MIGVGVISYQRPKHLDLWREQILKYSPKDIELSFYIDDPRRGIAYGKNQNLKDLKDCDYVFLMDSDCFPIKTGWAEFFIDASKASGQQHLIYLKETPTIKRIEQYDVSATVDISDGKERNFPVIINSYNNCSGCFMFFTKEVIEKVGAFGEYPAYYGYEHAGYTQRIHKAGLTTMGACLCPAGAGEYIYSMDLDFHRRDEFQKKVNHQPSMANELDKLNGYLSQNLQAYQRDIQTIYKPL